LTTGGEIEQEQNSEAFLAENIRPRVHKTKVTLDRDMLSDTEFPIEAKRGDVKIDRLSRLNSKRPPRTHPANYRRFRHVRSIVIYVAVSHVRILSLLGKGTTGIKEMMGIRKKTFSRSISSHSSL